MRDEGLHELVAARFARSMEVPERFFAAEEERIAQACWEMAKRFYRGGRLLAFGSGAQATDAQHVSVEFVHPVIVGKRALPSLALTNDSALLTRLEYRNGQGERKGERFVRQLQALARPQDMAMGFAVGAPSTDSDPAVVTALAQAREMGLLTLALTGGGDGRTPGFDETSVDFLFAVDSEDPFVIQETHETLYHVLWELVHIFFEHEGLLK
jgi:D-sedoheptulose 7-phosphate isomerase